MLYAWVSSFVFVFDAICMGFLLGSAVRPLLLALRMFLFLFRVVFNAICMLSLGFLCFQCYMHSSLGGLAVRPSRAAICMAYF